MLARRLSLDRIVEFAFGSNTHTHTNMRDMFTLSAELGHLRIDIICSFFFCGASNFSILSPPCLASNFHCSVSAYCLRQVLSKIDRIQMLCCERRYDWDPFIQRRLRKHVYRICFHRFNVVHPAPNSLLLFPFARSLSLSFSL